MSLTITKLSLNHLRVDISSYANTAVREFAPASTKLDASAIKQAAKDEHSALITSNHSANLYFGVDEFVVGLYMHEDILKQLKDHFGNEQIMQDSGKFIATQDAGEYIAGVFLEVVENMRVAPGAQLSYEQMAATRAELILDLSKSDEDPLARVIGFDTSHDTRVGKFSAHELSKISNISAAVNDLINDDKDLDGQITLAEALNVRAEDVKERMDRYKKDAKELQEAKAQLPEIESDAIRWAKFKGRERLRMMKRQIRSLAETEDAKKAEEAKQKKKKKKKTEIEKQDTVSQELEDSIKSHLARILALPGALLEDLI